MHLGTSTTLAVQHSHHVPLPGKKPTSTVELTAWGTPAHIALFVLGKIVVLTNLRVTALEERFRLFNCAVQVHYSTNSKVRPLGDADDTTLEATIPVTSHSPYIPPTQSLMESPHFQAPDESPSKMATTKDWMLRFL